MLKSFVTRTISMFKSNEKADAVAIKAIRTILLVGKLDLESIAMLVCTCKGLGFLSNVIAAEISQHAANAVLAIDHTLITVYLINTRKSMILNMHLANVHFANTRNLLDINQHPLDRFYERDTAWTRALTEQLLDTSGMVDECNRRRNHLIHQFQDQDHDNDLLDNLLNTGPALLMDPMISTPPQSCVVC